MNPLDKIAGTIISGLVISIIIVLSINVSTGVGATVSISTWVHVAAGVAWIGLLYYFNFIIVKHTPLIKIHNIFFSREFIIVFIQIL